MESIQIVGVPGRPRFLSRSEIEHAMTFSPSLTDRDRAALVNKVRSGAMCLIAEIDRVLRTGPAWLERRAADGVHAERLEIEFSRHPGGRILNIR